MAGAAVRCFLRLPRRSAFGTGSQGTPCISSNNEVSELFVGSSFRISLVPVAPFLVPTMCSVFVSASPNQIPSSHAASPLWSLFPDGNPRCYGAKILNKTVSANGTISCVWSRSHAARNGVIPPAPRGYLVTQNSSVPNHPHRQIVELFAKCPDCSFCETITR